MVTIIHGDDVSKSREYYHELKQKHKDFVLFDSNIVNITHLVQNIEGSGLFRATKAIFIEGFLTRLKKTDKTSKEILNYLIKNSKTTDFVLWESKEILKKDLFLFKNATLKIFKLPKNVFLFLDSIRPNNSKNLLNLFHQAIDSGIKEELILFMLQRQVRILLALSDPSDKDPIEELTRLAPWQMDKLEKQVSQFDKTELKDLYKKLYKIEINQKTGGLPLSLSQTIDFLLLEI